MPKTKLKQEVALVGNNEKAELATLAGVQQEGSSLSVLRVNNRDMDKNGLEYPVGIFSLFDGEDTIYGDLTNCKILSCGYQVREWNDADKKYASETIFFSNNREADVEDTAGGMRCGKMFGREVKELDEVNDAALIAAQKPKKFYRVIWGVTSIKGTYQDGTKKEGLNIPFLMRCTGNAFIPLCDYLETLKGEILEVETDWKIEKMAGASGSFYVAKPSRGKESPLTVDEKKTLYGLVENREAWNEEVMSKWRKKNGLNVSKMQTVEEVDAVVIDNDGPDDQIPF
jgi:hypothetical protein